MRTRDADVRCCCANPMVRHLDRDKLLLLVAGEIEQNQADDLTPHLQQCASCQLVYEEARSMVTMLGDVDSHLTHADLLEGIMAHATQRPLRGWRRVVAVLAAWLPI